MPATHTAVLLSPDVRPTSTRYDKTGEPFGVRPYHPSDRAALEEFYESFHPRRAAQGLPPLGRERVTRWLDSVLRHGIHLLAMRDEALVGHALLIPLPEAGVSEYAIFLHQAQRGRGVGTELSRAAVEAAQEAGLARLWLTVEPQNRAAMRAYEKVGFQFRRATLFSPEAEMTLELLR
jgi:RimJ/RimL family protein N-acetyltransferase